MTYMIGNEAALASVSRATSSRLRGYSHRTSRLLDALPWWVVILIAILTFLCLHQLALADVERFHPPVRWAP